MNYYAILPLIAFFANIILGCYILYKNPKEKLNQLFSLFAFSLAIWALGDVITFASFLSGTDLSWVNVGTFGSSLMPAFLLHFSLVFTKRKTISKKIYAMLLYLPGLFFIFIAHTTDLISGAEKPVYWGYTTTSGILYTPLVLYIVGYIAIGLFFTFRLYFKTKSAEEKKQAALINTAISIPLIGGIITEAIPSIIGFEIVPLSTTLTTITAIIIAYAIIKYGLMTPLSFSIKRKLIAIFLVFIISICTISIFAINTISTNAMEDQIYAHLETTAQSRASHIETLLAGYKTTTEMLAAGNPAKDIVDSSKNHTQAITDANRRINNTMQSISDISRIRVLDKNGIIIVSSHNDTGLDKSNHEIFLEGKEDTYIGDIHISEFTSNIVISISSPIFVNDTFSGVIVINFDVDEELFEIMSEYKSLGKTGEAYLVNKDGYMITPSRFIENTVLNQKVDSEQCRLCISEHIGGSFPEEMKKVPTTYQDYRGVTVLGTHYYISEPQWCLLAEIDAEEALAPITMMQNIIIIIFIIIGIFSMLFAYFFSMSISKPIIRLKDTAKSISEGNFDTKIDIKSKDEIGELADAFTDMAKDLREQQDGLENLVLERTKELETKIDELQRFKKVTVGRELKMRELKKRIKDLEGNVKK